MSEELSWIDRNHIDFIVLNFLSIVLGVTDIDIELELIFLKTFLPLADVSDYLTNPNEIYLHVYHPESLQFSN